MYFSLLGSIQEEHISEEIDLYIGELLNKEAVVESTE
jgi:hypothetical protein